jgi:hypothetical protein
VLLTAIIRRLCKNPDFAASQSRVVLHLSARLKVIAKVAKTAGVERKCLYRALSEHGKGVAAARQCGMGNFEGETAKGRSLEQDGQHLEGLATQRPRGPSLLALRFPRKQLKTKGLKARAAWCHPRAVVASTPTLILVVCWPKSLTLKRN